MADAKESLKNITLNIQICFISALSQSAVKMSAWHRIGRYGDGGPGPKGSVMSVIFELDGQEIFALNGGPMYKLTEAFSFYIDCRTLEEVDELWEKLSAAGSKSMYGWVTDKFGVTWQVVPSVLQAAAGR
jgi:predicted 3-demethylubiquinone-9 3-methyltransferase (glyoxalase superfamily)